MSHAPAMDANIGPDGVRRRLIPGVPLLVGGAIASFLTPSFFGQVAAFFGFLLVYQARSRICVALAARGACNLDGRNELLQDSESVEYFQKRARRIYLRTFLSTLVLLLAGRAWLHFQP
jgi:hypothetical protein